MLRVGLESTAALIAAASDLQVVRLLRDAMRAADAAAGPVGPAGGIAPRRSAHPAPRFEPRPVHEPSPRIEPRDTVELTPRLELAPAPSPEQAPKPPCRKPPIEPPWRILPWEMPLQPPPKVKLIIQRPDIVSKGSLIDFFI